MKWMLRKINLKKIPLNLSAKKIFSIRNKILVCFLVPLGFMIIIGTSAYKKAERGMSEIPGIHIADSKNGNGIRGYEL